MLFVPVTAPDPQLAANGVVLRAQDDGDTSWITEACNDRDIAEFIVEMPPPRRWAPAADVEFVIADEVCAEPLGLISLRIAEGDPGLASAAIGYAGRLVAGVPRPSRCSSSHAGHSTSWVCSGLS